MANLSDRKKLISFVSSPQSVDKAGTMTETAENSVPDGWLECDGSSVLVADYPDLFAAIGYTYGGAGANFNLPPNESVGKTDGVAVAAGNIGEILSTNTNTTLAGANWKSVANLSLTPGVWILSGTCEVSDGTTARFMGASISSTSGGAGSVSAGNSSGLGGFYQETLSQGSVSVSNVYVNVDSGDTLTYHLNIYISFIDGAHTPNNYLQAIRIA